MHRLSTKPGDSTLLSVIVPVYCVDEVLLRRCVESLVLPSGIKVEVLLVDDGSPDGCPAVCDEYAVRYENVFAFHTENLGVSNARNVGMEHARGEWVTFVDGDDYLLRGFLERVPDLLSRHPEADVIYFKYQNDWSIDSTIAETSGTGEDLTMPPAFEIAKAVVAHTEPSFGLGKIQLGAPWGKLIRRSFLEEHGCRFALGVRKSQDRVFAVELLSHKPAIAGVDIVGNAYVRNPDSVTHRFDPTMDEKLAFTLGVIERTIRTRYEGRERDELLDALKYMRFVFMYNTLDVTYLCAAGNPGYRRQLKEFKAYVQGYRDCIEACDVRLVYGIRNKYLLWCLKRKLDRLAYCGSMFMMDTYLFMHRK